MVPVISTPSVPHFSSEVLAFASARGGLAYLNPVLEMTRCLFPRAPVTVFVQEDPEIADNPHIVLEVEVPGWDVSQLVAVQTQWSEGIFQRCPSQEVPLFVLRMV